MPLFRLHSCPFAICKGAPLTMCAPYFLNASYILAHKLHSYFMFQLTFLLYGKIQFLIHQSSGKIQFLIQEIGSPNHITQNHCKISHIKWIKLPVSFISWTERLKLCQPLLSYPKCTVQIIDVNVLGSLFCS